MLVLEIETGNYGLIFDKSCQRFIA